MSALHKTLDETVAAIREDTESRIKAMEDKVLAAEVKATLLQDQLDRAVEARAAAERVTTKLITQFGVVEAVFAEAKALALAQVATPEKIESGGVDITAAPQIVSEYNSQ